MSRYSLTFLVLFGAAVGVSQLAGCPATPPASDDSGSSDSSETVSFSQQVQPIFTARCSSCHREGGFADTSGIAVRLTAEESYDDLLNQPSVQDSGLTLVVPGNADDSLLFQSVSSDQSPVGQRMPLFGAALSTADQALIRDWINQGALNN